MFFNHTTTMEGTIITIGLIEALTLIGSLIATIFLAAWRLSGSISRLDATITGLLTRLDDFHDRLINIEGKGNNAFQSSSPVSLTEKGKRIVEETGLKPFIDEHKDEFIQRCAKEKNVATAYDVQEAAFDFFNEYRFDPEFENKIKEFAYREGVSMDVVRRVAGIYFRDEFLKDRGMDVKEIDHG